jgi:hypothetical protein
MSAAFKLPPLGKFVDVSNAAGAETSSSGARRLALGPESSEVKQKRWRSFRVSPKSDEVELRGLVRKLKDSEAGE